MSIKEQEGAEICRNCGGDGNDEEHHKKYYRFGQVAFDTGLICEWCFMAEEEQRSSELMIERDESLGVDEAETAEQGYQEYLQKREDPNFRN